MALKRPKMPLKRAITPKMDKNTSKTKNKALKRQIIRNPDTWYEGKAVYYLCKKCWRWFLLENFNLSAQMCNECVKKLDLANKKE